MILMQSIKTSASLTLRKTQLRQLLSPHHFMLFPYLCHQVLRNPSSSQRDVMSEVSGTGEPFTGRQYSGMQIFDLGGISWIHSCRVLSAAEEYVEMNENSPTNAAADDGGSGEVKKKRKKLKGKRAVVRWLKFFRWKKKRDFQRMTPEEKILFKLKKARRKEERIVEALKKIEPKETSETTHDPEILTPEEHFYFLKMGQKCKNYVPVGRRGVYQGVILNMHLHWKKHQTLKVVVKTFTPEEVKEIAAELARLSGGIVLHIEDEDTIIMYRGKNYSQPPTEIMSPRVTLPRKKALDKSKYRDALRAVRQYIPRLEQELELLQAQNETKIAATRGNQSMAVEPVNSVSPSDMHFEGSDRLKEIMAKADELNEADDSGRDSEISSDPDSLSDIFESDSSSEDEKKMDRYLYLDAFEKFSPQKSDQTQNFEEHLRQVSDESRRQKLFGENVDVPDLDEVDKMVIQAASLLRKKRR